MKGAILVVEDHKNIREGMIQALAHAGFLGIPAANGKEALDYLLSGEPVSVIVLDLQMPVMNGWTFRQQQQNDPRLADIPTVVMSGVDSRPFGSDIPAAILQKPVDFRTLLVLLEVLCGSATATTDSRPQVPQSCRADRAS
jgi:two-component system, OmpR family, response regulator CpxR